MRNLMSAYGLINMN